MSYPDWWSADLGYRMGHDEVESDGLRKRIHSLTAAERDQIGLIPVKVVRDVVSDARFYTDSEARNGATIAITYVPISLERAKALKLADLAAYRYEIEVGGTVVAGITVPTDRQGRKDLRDARDALAEGILTAIPFKAASGWVSLTSAAQVAPLVVASAVHVNTSFAVEQGHDEAITAIQVMNAEGSEVDLVASVAAVAAYDFKTGWPQ